MPNRVRDNALRRERVQIDAMREVRAAWQRLLGPAPLLPDLLDPLLLLSNLRKVTTGQQVLWRSEVLRELLLVVQGDVGLGWLTPPAPLRIERSLHGPAWLDLSSAWLSRGSTMDGVALSDALLVNVSRGAYQTLMARQPELARRTVICLAEQVHAATGATHALMHQDAQARLATFLVQRCGADAMASQIVLHERKRDIASQLAVTPETLSRLLKQFSDDGLVEVHGYTIAILDAAGLRKRQSAAATQPRVTAPA
jgi:Crp-like helix-turn-helix domain